jgi:hypothetical protein
MIAVLAAVVGGLIAGIYTPLLSPVLYLLKSRRDLFLLLFLAYCLALGYEFEVANVYEADVVAVLAVILPSILLLDSGLKGKESSLRGLIAYAAALAILIGLFVREVFVLGVIIALFHHFSRDYPRRGAAVSLAGISLLILGLFAGSGMLNLPGGAPSQVVFISAVGILLALFFWRNIKTTELFS